MQIKQYKSTKFYGVDSYFEYIHDLPKDNEKTQIPTRSTFERENKIHTRKEVKDLFKNESLDRLSEGDCKLIINYLKSKYDEINMNRKSKTEMQMLINAIRSDSKIYLNSGITRIFLRSENPIIFDIQNPYDGRDFDMQEIYDLFPEA